MSDLSFWPGVLRRAEQRGVVPTGLRPPTTNSYVKFSAGRPGLWYSFHRKPECMRVNLHIYVAKDLALTDRYERALAQHRSDVERQLGQRLYWRENKSGVIIALDLPRGGSNDHSTPHERIYNEAVEAMEQFRSAFDPLIRELP